VPDHDVVIRGGTVVDGTGAPSRVADLAIDHGRISAVGVVPGSGSEEVEADGLLVTPGWVDVHTHYDGQATWDDILAPSSWHGVTTAVMGNCGVGFAPVRPDKHDWLIALMEGVEDIPGTALHEGISFEWESFPEYLEQLDRRHYTIDLGAQIPHAALRGYVMGDRGADHEESPTPDEVALMGRLAAEAIEAGALGFSTSRTLAHRSADGRPTPTLTAGLDELVGIAGAIGRTGKGVFELISDLYDLDSEFGVIRAVAEASGRPLSMTVLQRPECPPGDYRRILDLIDAAVADGQTVRGQVATRPVGVVIRLDGRINPLAPAPSYQKLGKLPMATRLTELRRTETRAAILEELSSLPGGVLDRLRPVFALDDPPRYFQPLDQALDLAGAYDALVTGRDGGSLYHPIFNYVDGTPSVTREMLSHPYTVPGLGDAGAHCTVICDGSFPTSLLQYWGRDAEERERLPVEAIVKQQCADTAALVGLGDRGILAPGRRADINLVDLDALSVCPPEMVQDLPAGGKRLVQRARGYVTTFVSGTAVMREGEPTGALPGRLVRGGRF
jgi:N-acyl-D-aspartate/D-glutamate deacylase